jgi:hypothetical protein
MKFICFLCLFVLWGCSSYRNQVEDPSIAFDSMSFGRVQVYAKKVFHNEDVCFEIKLRMKNVEQKEILPSNWTVAWIDQASHYHLLRLNQRDPASVPIVKKTYSFFKRQREWLNEFTTCAPKAKLVDVDTLIMNPKSLPFANVGNLTLKWK